MYISSPAAHTHTAKSSQFRSYFQIALCVLLHKDLQHLKETPDGCENTFFNITSFYCSQVHLNKLFSPQLKDQTDSDSFSNTKIIHILNENFSLDTIDEQKNSEKCNDKVINVFTLLEFGNSTEIENFTNYTFLAPHE